MKIAKIALLALGLILSYSHANPAPKAEKTKTTQAKTAAKKDDKKASAKKAEKKVEKASTKKAEPQKPAAKKAEPKKDAKKTVAKKPEPKKDSKKAVAKKPEPKKDAKKTVAAKGKKSEPAKLSAKSSGKASPQNKSLRERFIADAHRYIGVPYRWAGASPRGFDCSGYTSYVARKNGFNIPRSSRDQFSALPRSNGKRGDLVFFRKKGGGPINHVGIYLGGGKMIHAPQTGSHVKVVSINTPYWQKRLAGYRDPFAGRKIAKR